MPILKWIAYASWAAALLCLLLAMSEENIFIFSAAVSVAVSGVLFFAFNKVILLLSDIRIAVVNLSPDTRIDEKERAEAADRPVRSIDEIADALESIKARKR